MKKILILSLAFFLTLFSESNAQNYYDIYKIDTTAEKPLNDTFPINNKNSQLDDNNSKSITSTETTETEEVTAIRKKSKSRTAGNYIGIDFINTNLIYRQYGYATKEEEIKYSLISKPTFPKYKNSFGIKYSYAINYHGIFLAPELFFEYNNIKKYFDGDHTSSGTNDERLPSNHGYKFMNIHKIYGAKINLGYDISTNFAPYLFAGISKIYYSNLSSPYSAKHRQAVIDETGTDPFKIMQKSKSVPFFGFGGKIKLSEHLALNAEYLIYDFMARTNYHKFEDYTNTSYKNSPKFSDLRVALRVAKVGLTYNF
jgi:opacity protein-like surface antigen